MACVYVVLCFWRSI